MEERKECRFIGHGMQKEIDPSSVTVVSPSEKDFPAEEELPANEHHRMKLTRIPSVRFTGKIRNRGKSRLKVKKFEW